jgi:type I restriction enzyme R subunit
VPTNGSIFFTIFQTFMSGQDGDGNPVPYFGEYPADYFDLMLSRVSQAALNDESPGAAYWNIFLLLCRLVNGYT